ncbi:MAG: hypothetical protein M3O84_09630 [Actinomycetota bacterium]|nr:hypothetical protein [Actinomycetota bacterium]
MVVLIRWILTSPRVRVQSAVWRLPCPPSRSFADIVPYEQEEEAAYADPEFMKTWRQGAQFVVLGSGLIELLEPAPHLA